MIQQQAPASVTPDGNKVYPDVKQIEDIKLTKRMRSFKVSTKSKLQFVFQNEEGLPYDLSFMDEEDKLIAYVSELVQGGKKIELSITTIDASNGLLEITVPSNFPNGVYRGEVVLVHEKEVYLSNSFRLYVSRDSAHGIPDIAEIRLFIRDTHPEESFLLETTAFSDEEIVAALDRAIRYYNEIPPRIAPVSTQNFPWRHHLIEGILGQLYSIMAEECRKNALQYSAGGLSVADKDKEANYQRASQMHWDTYRQFVQEKKVQLSLEHCWDNLYSPYYWL